VPEPPVPPEVEAFLAEPNPAVVATLRPDGSPHTAATWYDWENGRLLLNMDDSRLRLRFMRRDRRVAVTVLGQGGEWYKHVSLIGRVVSLEPDADFADIDRLSRRYTGNAYPTRDRARHTAWVEPERWHAWNLGT
jgi:PPOX class probable F420-dependent enzyme